MTKRFQLPVLLLALLAGAPLPVMGDDDLDQFLDLNMEELLSMKVTSVSKKQQRLDESAAAIFVITSEDIQRIGATSIAEALRIAPGVQVAKMDSNKWAVSSRGFNGQFANKLLVLMDGRSIYTPSFSGVYWESQHTVMQDIDRIEVIRGPGAALWGANAVNGVINIITKSAAQTQGSYAQITAGNEDEAMVDLRYGGRLTGSIAARGYLSFAERGSSYGTELGGGAGDDWKTMQAGFRIDGKLGTGNWTLQGDIYDNDKNQIIRNQFLDPFDPANNPPNPLSPYVDLNIPDRVDSEGHNLLGRWETNLSARSVLTTQLYLDHTERDEFLLGQKQNTVDLDIQHAYTGIAGHQIIWGAGYRSLDESYRGTPSGAIPDQDSELYNLFLQDEIALLENKLRLTLGAKLERTAYSETEFQPNIKMLWLPKPGTTLWASISRAARTPSTMERRGVITTAIIPTIPLQVTVNGNDGFESEDLTAFEVGYRVQPSEATSLDIALFSNQYSNVATYEIVELISFPNPADPFGAPLLVPTKLNFDNKMDATSQGVELVFDWYVQKGWRLQSSYSWLSIDADKDSSSSDNFADAVAENSSPEHQVTIRSIYDFSERFSFDLWVHYYDELKVTSLSNTGSISDYTSLNLRLNWRPTEALEFSVVGHNLTDGRHPEFVGETYITHTEVERSIYGQVRLTF